MAGRPGSPPQLLNDLPETPNTYRSQPQRGEITKPRPTAWVAGRIVVATVNSSLELTVGNAAGERPTFRETLSVATRQRSG